MAAILEILDSSEQICFIQTPNTFTKLYRVVHIILSQEHGKGRLAKDHKNEDKGNKLGFLQWVGAVTL